MGTNTHYHSDVELVSRDEATDETVSIEQLRELVQLLDQSDVSEIEVARPDAGIRLVLRKAKPSEDHTGNGVSMVVPSPESTDTVSSAESRHVVIAPLVGIFHTWAKPQGRALVSVGDGVKLGQAVGTIQSLNLINEVEAPVAGRIVEILVEDGQPVEYGQHLMIIDDAEGDNQL